jgi:hypothetical protein
VIALLVGLPAPVIGVGLALGLGATVANTVLGFAIIVAVDISAAGWERLRTPEHRSLQSAQPLRGQKGRPI